MVATSLEQNKRIAVFNKQIMVEMSLLFSILKILILICQLLLVVRIMLTNNHSIIMNTVKLNFQEYEILYY